jgi:hypothetical protein
MFPRFNALMVIRGKGIEFGAFLFYLHSFEFTLDGPIVHDQFIGGFII